MACWIQLVPERTKTYAFPRPLATTVLPSMATDAPNWSRWLTSETVSTVWEEALTVYWKVVLPVKLGSGVNVNVPLWLSTRLALDGCVGLLTDNTGLPESPASRSLWLMDSAVYWLVLNCCGTTLT